MARSIGKPVCGAFSLFSISLVLGAFAPSGRCAEAERKPPGADLAIERGLAFLERDATRWREEKRCGTCHHGSITLWAMLEARRHGWKIDPEKLAALASWTSASFLARIKNPRDARPGFNLVNYQALLYGIMAKAAPSPLIRTEDVNFIQDHIVRHQDPEGSWEPPSGAGGKPPVFESAEALSLLAKLALAQPGASSQAAVALGKAEAWLNGQDSGGSTQVAALRLIGAAWSGSSVAREAMREALLQLQNKDGGWAQGPGLPSDAYATGQAVYALCTAGAKGNDKAVSRGAAFLVTNQRANGSWPMTPRAAKVGNASADVSPIVHFGSAWATLGLLLATGK